MPKDVIKNLVQAWSNTVFKGDHDLKKLDEGIQLSSQFNSIQEVIDKMVEDCRTVNDAETFLRDYCGIDQENPDTGGISGWEMGGLQVQTEDDVMPETLPAQEIEDFTNTTFVRRNLTVTIAENMATLKSYYGGKQILNNAYSWYIEDSIKLIEDCYGFYFKEGDKLEFGIENGDFAGITYGTTIKMNTTDKSTVAHEMTHFMQNIFFNGENAGFLQEGLADLTPGSFIDTVYAGNADLLASALNVKDYGTGEDYYYTAGYMFYRYFAKQASDYYDSLSSHAWTDNSSIVGTAKAELLTGNGENQTISGGNGNDTLTVYGKNSKVCGDEGNDYIAVGKTAENLTIQGGAGNDTISLASGSSNNFIKYDSGNDIVYGIGAKDTLEISGSSYSSVTVSNSNDVTIKVGDSSIILKNAKNNMPAIMTGNVPVGITLTNYQNNTLISGSEIADSITNIQAKNVTINTGAGNDYIDNYGDSVMIDAGTGNDYIYNSSSNVYIDAGAGADLIWNSSGNNSLFGGTGNDSIYNYGGSSVTIDTGAGNDYIDNFAADRVSISGGAGNDTIINKSYTNPQTNSHYYGQYATISGGAGNDSIFNSGANATINAGADNDTIINNSQNTTINGGAGNDYISLNSGRHYALIQYAAGDGNDTIYGIDANDTIQISGSSYTTAKSGTSDLKINIGTETILVKNGINVGFTIINSGGESDVVTGTSKADNLTNSKDSIKIDALAGNDKISNNGSNVTIIGGKGNDSIKNTGENVLYQYANGEGKDTISGFGANDTLQITKGTIKSSLVSGSDFILNVGSGSVTFKNIEGGTNINILNADGSSSVITVPKILQGTSKADSLTNIEDDYQIDALAGNDKITNSGSNVTIIGGTGNDSISNSGENVLYQYATGDGKDTIIGFGENDTLQITKGTIKNSLVSGNDLILTVGTGSITLKDVVGIEINLIDEKGKASTLEVPYVHTLTKGADYFTNEDEGYKVDALGGNDSIDNFADYAIINGGSGNDLIYTSGEGNIIQYANGDGNDVIYGFTENDSLQITKGSVTSTTITGGDTVLKIGTGSITLKDYVDDINFVGGANSRTLDILYDNNFMTDDTNLDSITEAKFAVTEIQNNKVEDFAQDSTLLTFAKEK